MVVGGEGGVGRPPEEEELLLLLGDEVDFEASLSPSETNKKTKKLLVCF